MSLPVTGRRLNRMGTPMSEQLLANVSDPDILRNIKRASDDLARYWDMPSEEAARIVTEALVGIFTPLHASWMSYQPPGPYAHRRRWAGRRPRR